MADMYGSILSSHFRVKDTEAFWEWLKHYSFGSCNVEFYVSDPEQKLVSFGSADAQYPSAYPQKNVYDENSEDMELEDIDINVFAKEFCEHLQDGEIVNIVAGGNEKLRYVSFDQLVISQAHPDKPFCRSVCTDDSKEYCLSLIHGTAQ